MKGNPVIFALAGGLRAAGHVVEDLLDGRV